MVAWLDDRFKEPDDFDGDEDDVPVEEAPDNENTIERDYILPGEVADGGTEYDESALLRFIGNVRTASLQYTDVMRENSKLIVSRAGNFTQGFEIDDLVGSMGSVYEDNADHLDEGIEELLGALEWIVQNYNEVEEGSANAQTVMTNEFDDATDAFGDQEGHEAGVVGDADGDTNN